MLLRTNNGGFHCIMDRYTVSVQIRYGTYSDNHNLDHLDLKKTDWKSSTCEIAIWNTKTQRWLNRGQPYGWVEVKDVFKLIGQLIIGGN